MHATLIQSLQSVRRRVRTLSVMLGVGRVLAAFIGMVLGVMLVDYLLDLPWFPRLLLILLAIGLTGDCLYRWVLKPLFMRLSLSDIAGRLENVFPQFDDRLRSTVDFADGHVPGSPVMQELVISQAQQLASKVDLGRAVTAAPAWYAMAVAIGVIGFAMLLGTLVGKTYRDVALTRLLSPLTDVKWPKRVEIVPGAVPARVPVGQPVKVSMHLKKGDKASMRAIIYYQYGEDGPKQQEYMTRNEDGTYTASIDAKADTAKGAGLLKVWMKAGDDQTKEQLITVVPRLAIERVEAVITPPTYAQLPAVTANLASGPALTAIGSQVQLRVKFNKALSSRAELLPAGGAKVPAVKWVSGGDNIELGTLDAEESTRFHIRATDADGFQNNALEEYELVVRPDQNPTVQIENPRRNEERTPEAFVPLQGVADDDYGVKTLTLSVDRLLAGGPTTAPATQKSEHWDIPLVANGTPLPGVSWNRIDGAADRQRFRANFRWELSELKDANLKPGDVLEYCLIVQDNFDLKGQVHAPVPSGKLRITLISQEEIQNRFMDEGRQVANQVGTVQRNQDTTKTETGEVKKELQNKKEMDAGQKQALERLQGQQSTAASAARQIAGKLGEMQTRMDENRVNNKELKETFKDVQETLNKTAEEPMKDAANQLNEAGQPQQSPQQRNEAMNKAGENQEKASQQLEKAMSRMANFGSLEQAIAKVREALEQQKKTREELEKIGRETLGKTKDQLTPEQQKKLDENAKQQEAQAGKTQKMTDDMAKQAQQMSKSDPETSQAMEQASKTSQQQQVSSKQKQASQQAKENQQSGAQNAQKQAELGLEMMLNDLKEAQRRKLEELSKKLAELQERLKDLIRRQAGHNIDNLALQGDDVMKKMLEEKALAELIVKANRDAKNLAQVTEIPQLSAGQEQTETTTRDIAQGVEKLPNSADTAAQLTRAARKMESAAVDLRAKKLPGAYDPSQVQALAALEEAKKKVDEQKKEVDKQKDEAEQAAIRDEYIKIRDDQKKKINDPTIALDAVPRLENGELPIIKAKELGLLPGEQGKLAEQTDKLGEKLKALKAVVYDWANKDIVKSMGEVKDDLGKAKTGKPTQFEQARIVEQLDAMIENLAQKPPDPEEFANRGGGGGGGGGSGSPPPPQLPPEVELRMLKALQVAVNKATKLIAGEPAKDKLKLHNLGGRQGELRNLLDAMLKKANDQVKLAPEPDINDQLPEEANAEQVEDQELEQELLAGKSDAEKAEKDIELVRARMSRSRQRLAIKSDPGKTTQIIQDRILKNLDALIQMARNQQQQQQQQQQGQGQQAGPPKPGQQPGQPQNAGNQPGQQSQPNRGKNAAQASNLPGPGGKGGEDLSQEIKETAKTWGDITPRQHEAMLEGASETVMEKYQRLVSDYYKTMAQKQAQQQR